MTDERTHHCARHTILVVEDEFLLRMTLVESLMSAGYKVLEADSGERALTVIRTHPGVSAIVTDLRMPGRMDGAALTQAVRLEFPHLKIVMVSGQLPDSAVRDLLDGHFLKPLDFERVAALLKSLIPSATVPSSC